MLFFPSIGDFPRPNSDLNPKLACNSRESNVEFLNFVESIAWPRRSSQTLSRLPAPMQKDCSEMLRNRNILLRDLVKIVLKIAHYDLSAAGDLRERTRLLVQ
jgi:hypothetical protein